MIKTHNMNGQESRSHIFKLQQDREFNLASNPSDIPRQTDQNISTHRLLDCQIARSWITKMTFVFTLVFSSYGFATDMASLLNSLPIQSGGRIKPFGTYAKESLQLIYGKSYYKDKLASEVVFTWLLLPSYWSQVDIVEIIRLDLREQLKLDVQKKHFSFEALTSNPRLSLIFQELETQRANRVKLNPYFQAAQRLEGQLQTFQAISSGQALALLPQKNTEAWIRLSDFNEEWRKKV